MYDSNEILTLYAERIDQYVEVLLRPYLDRLARLGDASSQGKEFNDPVWGTIGLNGAEVVVLDSPLLQRLRRIRQLGVGHYVYPGANHTRLEHSLGVCHQVQRLTDSIALHSTEEGLGKLPDEWVSILRMAALCHDIGHGLMSHVTENALQHDEVVTDLVIAFQRDQDKDDNSQLSEIAAYYMLKSPAMVELIKEAFRIQGKVVPPGYNDKMADCVIGVSNDEKFPLIHEVISGPFDCDKLDYMTRDAIMCGVPVVTDVTRLLQKVRAAETRTDLLPAELSAMVTDVGGTHLIIGVARSGASTLHEVSLGRSLMHDKIYRHHKVRATEAMVASVISQVGPLLDDFPPMIPFAIHDDQFINVDETRLASLRIAGKASEITDAQIATAADVARRMRDRQLFVRAFAFAQKMPFDAYKDDSQQRRAIEALIRDTGRGPNRRKFVGRIVEYLRQICDALNLDTLAAFPEANPEPYIWIDPPKIDESDAATDQSRAYLLDENRHLVMMSQVSAETRGWADAYINTRDVGYVFCPKEIADLVHVAAEIAVRVDRNIIIPREMRSYAKVEPKAVSAIRDELQIAGFYDNLPRDLRPIPDFLTKAGTGKRIIEATSRLSGYMGPSLRRDKGKAESGVLNATKIRDWLAQFPEKHIPLALKVVEGILLLDRNTINRAVTAFLEKEENKEFLGGPLVPLGNVKDGSGLLTYYAADVGKNFGCAPMSLTEAIATGKPLIFIDDIVGRGSSVISIFEDWLGLPDSQGLHEERDSPLGSSTRDTLLGTKIAIVTSAGRQGGPSNIEKTLSAYGFDVTVFALLSENDIPTIHTVLEHENKKDVEDFVEFCRSTGESLIGSHSKAMERALGYGNSGVLVVSGHNTPTMTLTVLWASNPSSANPWRPLLPRKQKV